MLSFHIKFVQTDRWTDRLTTVKQYAPDLLMQGHNNDFNTYRVSERDTPSCLERPQFFRASLDDHASTGVPPHEVSIRPVAVTFSEQEPVSTITLYHTITTFNDPILEAF